jgi:ABC-2 type transport system permease protein
MRRILALTRATWLTAVSYRMGMVFSVLALVVTVIPVYFVSQALQPVVAESIQNEGGNYFAFLVLGLASMTFVLAAVGAFPARLSSAISSGTLEAVLATPTRIPEFVVGLIGYDLLWAGVKAGLVVLAGVILGVGFVWQALPIVVLVAGLAIVGYIAIGVIAGGLVLLFRTSGPIVPGVVAATSLLGGVYYSTSVIPSWIHRLSDFIPLTYALRSVRRLFLDGVPMGEVRDDVALLAAITGVLVVLGWVSFGLALRYAKRTGTLSHY